MQLKKIIDLEIELAKRIEGLKARKGKNRTKK
jgi:hypothetical protein